MAISKFPAVRTSSKTTPEVKALADTVAQMTGQKGTGLDRVLTLRELSGVNGFNLKTIGRYITIDFDTDDLFDDIYDQPVTPTNVEFFPVYESVLARWDRVDANNNWFAYTEIFRADINEELPNPVFSDAALVATTVSHLYTDYVRSGQAYRYWVRHFGKNNEPGPLHDGAGTDVTTFEKPQDVLEEYSKDIYQSDNYAWLRSEMGVMSAINRAFQGAMPDSGLLGMIANSDSLLDLLAEQQIADALDKTTKQHEIKAQFSKNYAKLSGGIHAAVGLTEAYVNKIQVLEAYWETGGEFDQRISSAFSTYEGTAAAPDGAIATKIDSYTVEYKGNQITLDELALASANSDDEFIAQWGVKTNVNDLQGGVGFYNDGDETSFIVDANVFAVTGGTGEDRDFVPFVIKDGRVVIDSAVMNHASVWDLISQNITAENIVATATFESPEIIGGSITSTTLDVNGRFIVNAQGYMNAISATLKNLTVLDANNDVVMDSDGINGTYIRDLSVDTLKIKKNAITAASAFSIAQINIGKGSSSTGSSAVDNTHTDANDEEYAVLVNAVASCTRTSGGSPSDKIDITGRLKDVDGNTLDSRKVTVGIPGDKDSYHFIPFVFKGETSKGFYVQFYCSSHGESWKVEGWGSAHSAKR